MAKVPFRGSKNTSSQNASNTGWFRAGWGALGFTIVSEATIRQAYRTAGTATMMMLKLTGNDRATSTMTLRKNGADGNMTISTSTTGTFTDTTNSDTIAVGDVVNYQLITGSGGTTFVHRLMSMVFDSSSGTMSKNSGAAGDFTTASSSIYSDLGSIWNTTGETEVQHPVRTTMTMKNLYADVVTWTRSANTTIGSRKNTANGNLLVTVTAVGVYEDTSNSDSLVATDLIDLYQTNGTGAGSCSSNTVGVEFVSTNNQIEYDTATSAGGGQGPAAGATDWQAFGGFYGVIATTETDIQMNIGAPLVASNMGAFVHGNSWTGSPSVNFRKNTANGNQTKAITTGADGYYEDTTNSDALVAADIIDMQYVGGATGGGSLNRMGMKMSFQIPFLNIGKSLFINQAVNRGSTY